MVEQLCKHIAKDLKKSGTGSWLSRKKAQLKKSFKGLQHLISK